MLLLLWFVCLFLSLGDCFVCLIFSIFFLEDVTFQLVSGTNDNPTYTHPSNVPVESIASGHVYEYTLAWIIGSLSLALQPHLPTPFLAQKPITYYLEGIISGLHSTGLEIWTVPKLKML